MDTKFEERPAVHVTYRGKRYLREPNQTVLDSLLTHGLQLPHSCRSGICCSCMMKSSKGNIPAVAQKGLKDSLRESGYFLPCVCKPETDLEVSDPDETVQTWGEVQQISLLNEDVIQLRLKVPEHFSFRAGQFVSLVREDGLARSYSIASRSGSDFLELHVRSVPNGKMSSWIRNSVQSGDQIAIRGPSGQCFYSASEKDKPILLVGTGTGLAPLFGILQDALHQGHYGPIWLFHGGRVPRSLYYCEELRVLSTRYSHFQYRPSVLKEGTPEIPEMPVDQVILRDFKFLKAARIFLCGDPALVKDLRKKLFLAGASSKEIYADAFLPSS